MGQVGGRARPYVADCRPRRGGELHFGFRAGTQYEKNLSELEAFLADADVEFLETGMVAADRFSRIVLGLRAKGKPIPTNDIWVAAHAQETGADLVSFERRFSEIDGLVPVQPGAVGE